MKKRNHCSLVPIVKGTKEESKLYNELYDKFGNRNMALFAYGFHLNPKIKNSFSKSKLNSQGEPNVDELLERFNKEYISTSSTVVDTINTFNDKKIVPQKDPSVFLNKVLDFNNSQSAWVASIESSSQGFYVKYEKKDILNYKTNYNITYYGSIFDQILSILGSPKAGYSVDEIKNRYNFRNCQEFINGFLSIKGKFKNLWSSQILFLIKASGIKNEAIFNRLKDIIKNSNQDNIDDDKIDEIISKLVRFSYLNSKRIKKDSFEDLFEDIKSFVGEDFNINDDVQNTFLDQIMNLTFQCEDEYDQLRSLFLDKKDDSSKSLLSEIRSNAREKAINNSGESFGVKNSDLVEILEPLADEVIAKNGYHLKEVEDIASATKTLQDKLIKLIELEKLKYNDYSYKRNKQLSALKNAISSGNFIEASISFMISLTDEIKSLQNDPILGEFKTFFETLQDSQLGGEYAWNEDSRNVICKTASFVAKNQRLVSLFSDIISDIKSLEDDAFGPVSMKDIEKVKEIAENLDNILNKMNRANDKIQDQIVKSFVRISHKGLREFKIDGKVYKLDDLVEESKDISLAHKIFSALSEQGDVINQAMAEFGRRTEFERDSLLANVDTYIRRLHDKAGDNCSWMMERSSNGEFTGYWINGFNFNSLNEKMFKLVERMKNEGYTSREITDELDAFRSENTEEYDIFSKDSEFRQAYKELLKDVYGRDFTDEECDEYTFNIYIPKGSKGTAVPSGVKNRDVYYRLLALKMLMSRNYPMAGYSFFKAVQMRGDLLTQMGNIHSTKDLKLFIKRNLNEKFNVTEVDYDYGGSNSVFDMNQIFEINRMKRILVDENGYEIKTLPIFFVNDIQDKKSLNSDVLGSMCAYSASAMNYEFMTQIQDTLDLILDYSKNKRSMLKTSGDISFIDFFKFKGSSYIQNARKTSSNAAESLENMINKMKGSSKDQQYTQAFGHTINLGKVADTLTGITSSFGLMTNIAGGISNLLVGELQENIEAFANEFFGARDYGMAKLQYAEDLPAFMAEVYSNNKRSKMALLGDFLNVEQDFFEHVRDTGFKNSFGKRVIDKTNALLFYGSGEHILHYTTMYAILNSVKVWDKTMNTKVPISRIFDIEVKDNNGQIKINYDRFQWINEDGSKRDLTRDDVYDVRKKISYVNGMLHGRFDNNSKGTIHRTAIGRLLMNFRQWMPAHYARRFNSAHYSTETQSVRRGFYISLYKFTMDCVKDLKKHKLNIAASYNNLSKEDQHNIRRAIAETAAMLILLGQVAAMMRYKNKNSNWAYRTLLYELQRLKLEVQASNPLNVVAFLENGLQLMNSPMACLSVIRQVERLASVYKILETYDAGPLKGKNKYKHILEKNLPYYNKASQFLKMDDDMFKLFN